MNTKKIGNIWIPGKLENCKYMNKRWTGNIWILSKLEIYEY